MPRRSWRSSGRPFQGPAKADPPRTCISGLGWRIVATSLRRRRTGAERVPEELLPGLPHAPTPSPPPACSSPPWPSAAVLRRRSTRSASIRPARTTMSRGHQFRNRLAWPGGCSLLPVLLPGLHRRLGSQHVGRSRRRVRALRNLDTKPGPEPPPQGARVLVFPGCPLSAGRLPRCARRSSRHFPCRRTLRATSCCPEPSARSRAR